jgi:anionic cell wall polymer biosynthesis LytR-Cps2A-Psr (LCP) family protein
VETLENLGELPIGNNVVAHFDGVEDIVNAMGGITLEVEHSIEVGIEGQPISISAGRQTLGGRRRWPPSATGAALRRT